jgi:hypothetical protein
MLMSLTPALLLIKVMIAPVVCVHAAFRALVSPPLMHLSLTQTHAADPPIARPVGHVPCVMTHTHIVLITFCPPHNSLLQMLHPATTLWHNHCLPADRLWSGAGSDCIHAVITSG